jgi:uncharacterized membrane protein
MEEKNVDGPSDENRSLLPHVAETVQIIAQLHAEHHLKSSPVENAVDRWTEMLGHPRILVWIGCAVLVWVAANLTLGSTGLGPIDPPPFNYLQGALSAMGLVAAVLILSTQRRAGQLAELREQMTLELASLTERKVAKVISLIEEQRRDSPAMRDRIDPEASDMIEPTDPHAVLGAIKDTHDEMVSNADKFPKV